MSESYSFVKQISQDQDFYLKGKKVGKRFKQNAHILLIHIHSLCQRKNGVCNATTEYMCKILGKKRRQVTYYLQYLRETGQIHVNTSEPKKEVNRFGGVKFYKNRLIQSYHDHKPDHYDEVNSLFFNSPEKIKSYAKTMEFNIRTHDKLVDYKGRNLPPKRVGYETKEYFEERLNKLFPDQKEPVIITEPKKESPVKPSDSVVLDELDLDPDFIMFKKNRVIREPEDLIEEPDPGNELRDLKERLRKKREKESEEFWEDLEKDGSEEEHKPISFTLKLNLKIPYKK